jgi:hypothetical protein|tara:strand:+ start:383 stop:544 length:162 start_codon:yes stop_codon:yes gene_type:complete
MLIGCFSFYTIAHCSQHDKEQAEIEVIGVNMGKNRKLITYKNKGAAEKQALNQ